MQADVAFAYVDYQESVVTSTPLEPKIENSLKIRSFPSYPRMDYSELPNYEGLKIFGIADTICISYFLYMGEKDELARPLLSARVAIIPTTKFDLYGRDVIAVRDFLKVSRDTFPLKEDFFYFIENNSFILDNKKFKETIQKFDLKFLINSISCLITHDKVSIYYLDTSIAESFIRVVYSILPLRILKERSFSTECEVTGSPYAENYVMIPMKEKKRLFPNIFDKKNDKRVEINLEKKKSHHGKYTQIINAVVSELAYGEDWYTISWKEKYQILVTFLDKIISGERVRIVTLSEKLSKMSNTIERIKSIENTTI